MEDVEMVYDDDIDVGDFPGSEDDTEAVDKGVTSEADAAPDTASTSESEAESDNASQGSQEQQAPSLDPMLLVKMGSLGVSGEKAEKLLSLGSNEAISTALELLGEKSSGQTAATGEVPKIDWAELPEDLSEIAGEELGGALKEMSTKSREAVERLMAENHQLSKAVSEFQQGYQRQQEDTFDEALLNLGDDWADVFGPGYIDELGENSAQRQARQKVWNEIDANPGKYRGSVATRVAKAAKAVFPDKVEKIAKRSVTQKARDRQGRFLSPGATRKQDLATVNPTNRAVANVREKMQSILGGTEESDISDSFHEA